MAKPLTAEDVAEVCAFAVNLPHHVNLDLITVKPVAQAAVHELLRQEGHSRARDAPARGDG